MSNTDRRLEELLKLVEALARDVNDIKHTLNALTVALQVADTAPALIENSKRAEAEAKTKAEHERKRDQFMMYVLGAYNGPRSRGLCIAHVEQRIAGTAYAPLRKADVRRYNLDGRGKDATDDPKDTDDIGLDDENLHQD